MPDPISRRLAAAAAIAFVLLGGAGAGHAADASGYLQVTAVVRHFWRMQVLSQPPAIELSQRDVEAGYVEVTTPLQLAVESNSANGYTIQFARIGEHVRGAQVQGLGREWQLAPDAAISRKPAARREILEFRFRLQLAPNLRPGSYPWPITVSMEAA